MFVLGSEVKELKKVRCALPGTTLLLLVVADFRLQGKHALWRP
jgi:hypothetical protein